MGWICAQPSAFSTSPCYQISPAIITMETRDGKDRYSCGIIANFFHISLDFFFNFIETGFAIFGFSAVHFVNSNNELFDTKGKAKKDVFPGLAIFGNTSFKLTSTGGYN